MRAVRNKRATTSSERLGWTEIKGQDVRSPWAEINDSHARAILNMEKVGGYWKAEPGIEEVTANELPTGVTDGYDLTGKSRYAACFWGDWFLSIVASGPDKVVVVAQKDGVSKVAVSDCVPSSAWEIPTGLPPGPSNSQLYMIELFPLPDRVLIRFGRTNSFVDCYVQLGADGKWRWWPLKWDAPKLWKFEANLALGGNFESWAFAFELVRKDSLGVTGATSPRSEMYGGTTSAGGWVPNASAASVQPIGSVSDSAGTNSLTLHIDSADWTAMTAGTNRAWTHFRVWRTRRLTNTANPADTIPGNLQEWMLCREYERASASFLRAVSGVIEGDDIISGTALSTTFTYAELIDGDTREVVGADAPTNVNDPNVSLRALPDVWDCCVANNLIHSIHRPSTLLRDGDAVTAVPYSGYYAFRWNPSDYDRVSSATQGDLTAIEEHSGDVYAFKNNSSHIRPLGDRDLPFRVLNDMVGVSRFDKCRNTPLGILGLCSDDSLRLLRGGEWVERLAAASLSSGVPIETHDRTVSARTWIAHNAGQIVLRTFDWALGYPRTYEQVWHHGQFGGLSTSDIAASHIGVISTAQSQGCTWWANSKVYRKTAVPSSDVTTDGSAESATSWSLTTALLGNRKEPRHYDFKYMSALVSATASTQGAAMVIGGGIGGETLLPDSDATTTKLFASATMWEVNAAGGHPLAIDPTWKGNEQREIRYYPSVANTSNAVDFNRHRVYGTAIALGISGTGAVALHSIQAEVRVSSGGNYDAMRRPSQTDWTDLELPTGDITSLGIHDLETEPWTWS